MYTEKDYQMAQKNAKRVIYITVGILVVALVLTGVFVALRQKWPAVIALALGAWIAYAFYSFKGSPWVCYRRYLRDVREGLSRQTDCFFVSMSENTRTVDGVDVYDLTARVGDGEEDERLFYWDADKTVPALHEGQAVHIVSYGKFVTQLSI